MLFKCDLSRFCVGLEGRVTNCPSTGNNNQSFTFSYEDSSTRLALFQIKFSVFAAFVMRNKESKFVCFFFVTAVSYSFSCLAAGVITSISFSCISYFEICRP